VEHSHQRRRTVFDVAKTTIGGYIPRVKLTKADRLDQAWPHSLSRQPGAIVSTWAPHDRGGQQAVAEVYARCFEVLPEGSILMNGDFIKPDGTSWTYEPDRFEIGRHLERLRRVGFKEPAVLALFEHILDHPTASQNHACLIAVK
jgi:hypothetical protein